MMRERQYVVDDLTENDSRRMDSILRVVDSPEEAAAILKKRGII